MARHRPRYNISFFYMIRVNTTLFQQTTLNMAKLAEVIRLIDQLSVSELQIAKTFVE